MAKCRLGCLPIGFETGRYSRPILIENERTCQICTNNDISNNEHVNEVENEVHVLFNCNRYAQLRNMWIEKLTLPIDYRLLNSYEKLYVVLNHAEN